MYLLDSNCTERMERGTPQRKTVYRISLTLVKRESLDDGDEGGGVGPRRAENPKVGAFRREGSVEVQRGGLLEQLKEVDNESEDFSSSKGYMRNFRTFSMGQLELGRLKTSRKHQKDVKETADPDQLKEEICSESCPSAENLKKKRLLKAKSVEERSSEPPVGGEGKTLQSKSSGKTARDAGTPPLKRPPGLLRRSFSFRHWTGGELLRLKALSKEKHHSSSGCIVQDTTGPREEAVEATVDCHRRLPDPSREKSRTLEVGAVLNKTDSMTELSRLERARGGKNRTLDNSDLLRLSAEKDASGGGFLLRGGGGRSSERRLVRFFSGIFSRRDGATTSTPVGSPGTNRSLRRIKRTALSQSSTESMNGGSTDGKYSSKVW